MKINAKEAAAQAKEVVLKAEAVAAKAAEAAAKAAAKKTKKPRVADAAVIAAIEKVISAAAKKGKLSVKIVEPLYQVEVDEIRAQGFTVKRVADYVVIKGVISVPQYVIGW